MTYVQCEQVHMSAVNQCTDWRPKGAYGSGMTLTRSRARTLGLALCAAFTVMSLSSVAATADTKAPADPGVRCAAKSGPGQYEFYLPGEKATDVNGNKWVCGPDGNWFRDYSGLVVYWPTTPVRVSLITTTTALVAYP